MEKLPYYNSDIDRENAERAQSEAASSALEVLNDPYVHELASEGKLSVAIIRPQVGPDANLQGYDDLTAADKIEEQIQNLGVVAKFSFYFDEDIIETFYEGPSKESMRTTPPQQDPSFPNKWEEFKNLMISGPSTVLLLHSPDDAITEWRSHLGHWNIEKTRDPSTIRGRMGVNNFNNLVHGSDAPESVIRELGLISESIQRYPLRD